MIFGRRIEITGKLTLETDLHIGASDTGRDAEDHKISLVARDADDKPIIPAPSLKGVLRAGLADADAKTIFGDASEHRAGVGHAALLWLDHARLATHSEEELCGLSTETPVNGVFRAKHVALDPATGAAEEHKLFTREMVAAGARFTFHADWFGDDITELAKVFALLRDGVQLGRGSTKGHGCITLDPTTLSLKEYQPDAGALKKQNMAASDFYKAIDTIADTSRYARRITLSLQAEGPFLSARENGEHNQNNQMQPLEKDGKPVLWPESLTGALRQRARWLVALADGDHRDDPSCKRNPDSLCDENLSPVERLFGVTGRKGQLNIKSLICRAPGNRVLLQNNSIDRFTGATRDGALYGKNAFWQPCFVAKLEVKGDHKLLDALLADLKTEGLELGHGASTGFGWFAVEVTDDRT